MDVAKRGKNNNFQLLFVYVKKKQYLCSDYGVLWTKAPKDGKNTRNN